MKIRPLHDWAIIQKKEPEEKTSGGIIIPDSARDVPTEGTVVAIGPGRFKKEIGKKTKFIPTILHPGQRVFYMEYSSQEIEINGKEFTFVREEDILGTYEEESQIMLKETHAVEPKLEQPLMVQEAKETSYEKTPPKEKPLKKKAVIKKKKITTVSRATKTKARKKSKPTKKTKVKKLKSIKPKKQRKPKKTVKKTSKKSVPKSRGKTSVSKKTTMTKSKKSQKKSKVKKTKSLKKRR